MTTALEAAWNSAADREKALKAQLREAMDAGDRPARILCLKWRVRAAWDVTEETFLRHDRGEWGAWGPVLLDYPEDQIAGFACILTMCEM